MGSSELIFDQHQRIIVSRFPLPEKEKAPLASKKKKIIVLSGPTAVGKSQLSLCIAQAIGGEVISADSMQVYRGMDIGTAKVTLDERRQIPHHLIDSRDLDESFNVVEFYSEAMQAIEEIFSKGKIPIVVGGTGFYIHSLLYGPPSGPPSVPELRQKLEDEMELRGAEPLYDRLKNIDPEYAATITQRDRHKIIRALEIISLTQQKVSSLPIASSENTDRYDFRCWFIYMPKEVLYPRIEERCDQMIAKGFLEEVRQLEKEGLRGNQTACQAIGYRQCLDFLSSDQSQEAWMRFVHEFKQASRRYAKRQFTWFRKEPLFRWLNIENTPLDTIAEVIIQDYEVSF
ncbi:MAG: tRNA (adenosine(37)-N6)-dimethylallyltransferase MiaA [Rhabdochlamydiaceae bacterium]|nr:tRNA (adenosine(37)-N6)-dimethylallyltransferase MiaA [Rhabdochlamydiaceae bacterium]